MLAIFAVIVGGIITGRLLSSRRLTVVSRFITIVIWVLLFLLGLEVGSDPAVVNGLVILGGAAFVIFALSVSGSIGASWLLWRQVRRRIETAGDLTRLSGADTMTTACSENSAGTPLPMWDSLKGSLVIVLFFVAGCAAGLSRLIPFDVAGSRATTYVLYVLMFCVGITLGNDATLFCRLRKLDRRLLLLPAMTAVGSLAGAALAMPLLTGLSVTDTLSVGAGFGYYSLSSIVIADFRGVELATVALLCNVMRELFTLLAAPLVSRMFGPLAAISIGGATTFDVTLPVITRAAGKEYAVVSIFHGCMLDLSVPFLVTFFCTL